MERSGTFPDPQQELIANYCMEARRLLEQARDMSEAIVLAEEVCARFAGECRSSLVLSATRAYIEKAIQERWKEPHS